MDLAAALQHISLSSREDQDLRSFAATIRDTKTDFLVSDFEEHQLLVISQYQRFGSLIEITPDRRGDAVVYTVKPIMGGENANQLAAARHIAERLNITKVLVLFLCLKSYDGDMVKGVCDAVVNERNS